MTFSDLLDNLKREDEVTLIEMLNLNSEDLVDILESYIYDNQDRLRKYYDENESSLEWEEE